MTAPPTAFGDYITVERADVYKASALVGHLTRTPTGNEFRYTQDWIRNDGTAIASTLPVTGTSVHTAGGSLPAYFTGLLPEGRRLLALRGGIKTSPDDELSLLLGVGQDTIGDVSVVPEGEPLQPTTPFTDGHELGSISFDALVADLDHTVDPVALPGVQDKVSASMINLPRRTRTQQVLLKLTPAGVRHLVENEHFFLSAATATGMKVVEHSIVHDRDGVAGLAVVRFDRTMQNGAPGRLPVEDGCQALGLPPAAKYRVTTEDVLLRLSSLCESPLSAAREFLTMIAFAYLTGNGDAHAKNFSVMQDLTGRWQPTPAYDLLTTTLYGDHTMALDLGGLDDTSLTGRHFLAAGAHLGLPGRATARAVKQVADRADEWIDHLPQLPFTDQEIRKLTKAILLRRTRLMTL